VSWFLTFKPGLSQALLNLIPFVWHIPRHLHDLNLFKLMDLGDYVALARRCLHQAVDGLVQELGGDVSQIDRKSKGVLDIW
jgi:hypothetical protein